MSERRLADELEASLETSMTDPTHASRGVTPRLAALLRVAGELRDLPSERFKARLGEELRAAAHAAQGQAAPSASPAPALAVHDVHAALAGLPDPSMRFFDALDQCTLGVSRFTTNPHWERHPAGDELLYFLEGEAEIETLTDDGTLRATARAGSIFVCPQGLWHRVIPRSPVSMFFATPGEGIEHSNADDPRRGRPRAPAARAPAGGLAAHDLRGIAASLPLLAIEPETTEAEANAAFRTLARVNRQTLGLTRFSGQTPWERHPDGDELLCAVEGDVDVSVLTDAGLVLRRVLEGSVFVCPRGLWHRQLPRDTVTLLYATPSETTQISFADDPRVSP